MKSEMQPMDQYNRSMNKREEEFMQTLREAALKDDMAREKIHGKLYKSTYARPGMLAGLAMGIGAGGGAGALLRGRKFYAVPLALGGGLLGGTAGFHVGGRIRKNKEKAMSSNLKPALRELAARSEKLTEFAMVRDANGQFVEVDDKGGMGVGTALKVGAGAAALGGAGYGVYRADKAIMDKYAPGVIERMAQPAIAKTAAANTAGFGNSAGVSAEKLAAYKAAKESARATGVANATENFGKMGFFAKRGATYGAGLNAGLGSAKGAGMAGLNAAKASGVGKGLRGALLGAAKWLKPVAAVV